MGIHLHTHTPTKRSSQTEESAHTRGGQGYDARENLPKLYWAEASNTTIYLINRWTTFKVPNVTPHEKYYGRKADLSHLQIYGTICAHSDEKWQKLDPKSEKCILVEYSLEQTGYKCFNPSTRKVCVSREVVFDESASWYTVNSLHSTQSKLISTKIRRRMIE